MCDKTLTVVLAETNDPAIKCIHAIRQVMNHFSDSEGLSADGKDRRSVYVWFMERYKPGITMLK